MKFTLSWLKKHLETSANLDEILLALTDLGLEVENVVDPIEALKDFTIGKVLSAEQHQNADKLRVCQVQTDEGELLKAIWHVLGVLGKVEDNSSRSWHENDWCQLTACTIASPDLIRRDARRSPPAQSSKNHMLKC